LWDADPTARQAALDALAELRPVCVACALREAVGDADIGLRRRAIEVLTRSGDAGGTDILLQMVSDGDTSVSQQAICALWDVATSDSAKDLAGHLSSPDPKVRCAVAGVLGEVRAVACAGRLAAALGDPHPDVRVAALEALCGFGESAAEHLDAVADRLCDANAHVRTQSLVTLASIAPASEDVARRVAPHISDPDQSVRDAAAGCLLGFVERGVSAPVMELLADVARRPEALEVLQHADGSAVRKLLELARGEAGGVGSAASDTLAYVVSMKLTVDEIKHELESFDPAVRVRSVEILGLVGGDEAVAQMICLLERDPSREVRLATIGVLAGLQAPGAVDALREAAHGDPDTEVRRTAEGALADDDRGAEARKAAESALEDGDPDAEVRQAAESASEGASEDGEDEYLGEEDAELAGLVATWYEKEPD
jgi:HEAT repeat protein